LDLAVRFAETAFAWRQADRQVKLLGERLIPKAKAALDSARSGYAAGMSSFADLLEGQRMVLDYQLGYASAVGEREMVLAEMSLVILGRWPQDVTSFVPPSLVGEAPSRGGPSVDTRR
jgi:outer membrane protein TolC